MDECERDNQLIFKADATFSLSDGAISCEDNETISGIWTYTEAHNSVTIVVDNEDTTTFNIQELKADIFEARMEEDSISYCIITFEHPTN